MSADKLLKAARKLSEQVGSLTFDKRITHIYNPLEYAWAPYKLYIRRFGLGSKQVLFLGMNPGPWGMAQTGIPFGEIESVRDWMGICAPVQKPGRANPKRPVDGFSCSRSEVSGKRFWGLMRDRFGPADTFFLRHFVANYCPLVFMEASGKNFTPDKLPADEKKRLFEPCDTHLRRVVSILDPKWLIGIGKFAEKRLTDLFGDEDYSIGNILHPSPANPHANRGWAEIAARTLTDLGVWDGA